MPVFELWCEMTSVFCPVVHSRVGKYPMQLGFWEYLLRKYYCEICLLCWDCQLFGAVSRTIWMVPAMHQSILSICFMNKMFLLSSQVWKCKLSLRQVCVCGRLTLAGCQVPIKLLYCSPFPGGQGRENKMEDNSWIEIKQFAKAKAKVFVCTKRKKIGLFSTSHQQAMCDCLLGSRVSTHVVVVAPEGKPSK